MLCFDVLRRREMKAKDQYLATVDALLSREQPEASRALDVYIRVRAAEIATSEYPEGKEPWQAVFGECYGVARKAMERFLATPDRLERVFAGSGLERDFSKKNEHIDQPLEWFMRARDELLHTWRLGRPSEEDALRLRSYLETAFQSALLLSREFSARSHRAEGRTARAFYPFRCLTSSSGTTHPSCKSRSASSRAARSSG